MAARGRDVRQAQFLRSPGSRHLRFRDDAADIEVRILTICWDRAGRPGWTQVRQVRVAGTKDQLNDIAEAEAKAPDQVRNHQSRICGIDQMTMRPGVS